MNHNRLAEGARLREDRDAIEAQIALLTDHKALWQRYGGWVFGDPDPVLPGLVIADIDRQLVALEDALDEADDTIGDVDPERPYRPQVL
jgi:hypothetical protein